MRKTAYIVIISIITFSVVGMVLSTMIIYDYNRIKSGGNPIFTDSGSGVFDGGSIYYDGHGYNIVKYNRIISLEDGGYTYKTGYGIELGWSKYFLLPSFFDYDESSTVIIDKLPNINEGN